MGRSARSKPARLAEKLQQIRVTLNLSQNEMIKYLGLADDLVRASISGYELGTRVPPLPVLLRYARATGITVEVLIDDELELPSKLPSRSKPDRHR